MGDRWPSDLPDAEENMVGRHISFPVRTVDFPTCKYDEGTRCRIKLATRLLQCERRYTPLLPLRRRPRSRLGPLLIAASGLNRLSTFQEILMRLNETISAPDALCSVAVRRHFPDDRRAR